MTIKNRLPEITDRRMVAKSRFFAIEQIDLAFSNGQTREYERMAGAGRGAVMVVPMLDKDTMILVREYCAGTHSYELGFPKGLIDAGESGEQAANRELQEEIGYGAEQLVHIHDVAMAPAFFNAHMKIYLATGLYPSKLEGDEPEPLEVVTWPLADYQSLLSQGDFNEARSIAALMLVRDQLTKQQELK
ncbi:ADP compounds hydrolase NudE [Thalassotalea euphylliae]|uniref:ADP compounds hydrolase NudE n=1 Tax=Thalassotalea euphylliae TaxID=1655234 RepID=A0A3E0TUV3_9GAMM|nr:ADP compounds hydrolase NudE [Thalassotalea euphylliae]REL28456.1 ADP compounds hydrolase NudE [Thalassotalea euphylliae]